MDREDTLLAYMQDRLGTAEREDFEGEIAADPQLAAEVVALKAVRKEAETSEASVDRTEGWNRLSAAIDAEAPKAANDNRAPWISVFKVAAMIVAAVMVWEIGIVQGLGLRAPQPYVAVSEGADAAVLQIVFKQTAVLGEVATVLADLGGTVQSGPSSLGVYRLAFADDEARDAARASLALRTDLIELMLEE